MALTLIAGLYGMNAQHIPEPGWQHGYAFALTLMLATGLGLDKEQQDVVRRRVAEARAKADETAEEAQRDAEVSFANATEELAQARSLADEAAAAATEAAKEAQAQADRIAQDAGTTRMERARRYAAPRRCSTARPRQRLRPRAPPRTRLSLAA